MTHGFVVEFRTVADRDYFLEKDPAHREFVSAIIPENNDFLVLDFSAGTYLGAKTEGAGGDTNPSL